MNDLSTTMTVGDVVARDLRSATVFARHGIDFCCGGRRSIEEACRASGVEPDLIVRELQEASGARPATDDRSYWKPDRVIDRVIHVHHAYVRRQIPIIQGYLDKLADKHGERHPNLLQARQIYEDLSQDLLRHLAKEETILFPYILALTTARRAGRTAPPTPFGTIQNPVRMMEAEHQEAGEDMWLLRRLTNNYEPPEEACLTWRACYAELAAFEHDLHEHVHLENNILFPAAARLEEMG